MGASGPSEQRQKLQSWKEIASFLGKDVRTARRWNAERGLPVHRVPGGKGASVFAYTDELEAWLNNSPATGQPDEGMPAPPEHDREAPSGRFSTEPADLSEPGKRPEFSPAARSPGSPYARLLILLVVAMSLAGGSYIIGGRLPIHNEAMPAPKRVMIAVLPFLNLSGETQQEYLADGMTEEMITALGGLNPEELGVIARTSVMTFKGSARPVREIGKNLGVDYVLEGSVTREGKRVRVIAQLIRVSDQTHLWAGNYDSDSPDILASENQVAGAIAAQIRINLQPNARIRSAGSGTVNPVAHEDYLMGRFYWNQRNAPAYEQARKYFTAALEKDPGYAAAYAGLADSYFGGPQAEGFARKAIELDDSVAEAHASLGYLKLTNDWDARGAEAEYRRALELDPNYVTAHHWYALLLAQTGRPDRAIAEIEMARELDPLSVVINTDSGMILYWARRYDPAVAQLQRALELDPHFDWAHFWLGRAYEQQGKYDKAIQNFQAARDLTSSLMDKTAALGHVYALAGRRSEAEGKIAELRKRSAREEVSPVNLAEIYTALGDKDLAFRELEIAYRNQNAWLLTLRVEPSFDPLRGDPRYGDLLRRSDVPRPMYAQSLSR